MPRINRVECNNAKCINWKEGRCNLAVLKVSTGNYGVPICVSIQIGVKK